MILIQIRIGLPLILFFTCKSIFLYYEIPFKSFPKRSQKLCICGSFKPATNNWTRKLQIAKIYVFRKSQIRKLKHLRKIRKSMKIYLSPQICGFAICGTYVRTAHLCNSLRCKKQYVRKRGQRAPCGCP